MKIWIISYVSITIICFIAQTLLENTKFSTVANKCITIISISSIIGCSISIISSTKNLSIDFNSFLIFDSNYVEKINSYKINTIKNEIESKLNNSGISGVSVYFSTTINDKDMVIEKIHLDFQDSEYSLSSTNIDVIKEMVRSVFMIEEECIILYG